MDVLNDLIAATKKDVEASVGSSKHIRRGAADNIQEKEERRKRRAERKERKRQKRARQELGGPVASNYRSTDEPGGEDEDWLSKSKVVKLLRSRGEPITLFGETDRMRLQRLRKLESQGLGSKEEQKGTALGKSAFRFKDDEEEEEEEDDQGETEKREEEKNSKKRKVKDDDHITKFIKRLLGEWQVHLDNRNDMEMASQNGRKDMQTFKQCKQALKPFLKLLKHNAVAPKILEHVGSIVALCEQREYVQAANSYLELAVGNEPWPIGVTNVGIHQRKGRERINAENVAHVMNDEAQRQYITSLKRLMTFCQSKYPSDPSRMMQ